MYFSNTLRYCRMHDEYSFRKTKTKQNKQHAIADRSQWSSFVVDDHNFLTNGCEFFCIINWRFTIALGRDCHGWQTIQSIATTEVVCCLTIGNTMHVAETAWQKQRLFTFALFTGPFDLVKNILNRTNPEVSYETFDLITKSVTNTTTLKTGITRYPTLTNPFNYRRTSDRWWRYLMPPEIEGSKG